MKRLLVLVGVALAFVPGSAKAADKGILAYTGNGAFSEGYTRFASAAGRTLDTQAVLPSDLSVYECIVLPVPATAFDAAQTAALSSFASAGGRVIAIGEASPWASADATLNALAAGLGSTMTIVPGSIDQGFFYSGNLGSSVYTSGASSVGYGWTSTVTGGTPLFFTAATGSTSAIAAVDAVGSGALVLSGDSNAWSDNSGSSYGQHDNGVIARNLCGKTTKLFAGPLLADIAQPPTVYLALNARLINGDAGTGIGGATIQFLAGATVVCTGTTDASGAASCSAPDALVAAITNLGYTARFAGAEGYQASEAHGVLIRVLGNDLP